jgi:phage N-6-adenine-methyltransferase
MNKETQKLMFSSNSAEWSTPKNFYEKLNNRFQFDLDPCCTKETSKCEEFYTEEDDGLTKSWSGKRVFMNPPYGRGIDKWIEKAYKEGQKLNTQVVCLIPARTDTKYWHKFCMKASEIYFVKGRLHFENKGAKQTNAAPFPSAVVIFRGPPIVGMPPENLRVGAMDSK